MTRIIETATGFDLVNDEGAVLSSHATVLDALAASAPRAHEPHLRENGEPVGEFRWLDAASTETASEDGYFDATALAELVDSLNTASMPVPIDGGAAVGLSPSPVHGTADDSSTPANGWGHAGALVELADGPHMFMWSELWPSVAQDVDRGRIAYGSVLAMTPKRAEDGAYRECRLVGHALTNVPVIRTLTPSTAVRAFAPSVRSLSMTTKTEPKITKKADPPAAPPPAPVQAATEPPPPEDKDATIAALRSELEAAKAQIDALMAEAAAKADEGPTEEEKVAAAVKAAEVVVDTAVKAGTVAPAARAKWVDVVMKSGEKVFADLTRGMRARPAARQVQGPEATNRPVQLDADDPFVKTMRAAKVSDASIAKALIERVARKEN